ncbi:MAG: 4-hydroxythreonine-4-phosphate dehydrogenase PdxA [Holophagaceae bacterium]|nr:4-hydroxythreonine-4-phosphate dehydrogenase PdxA [Holophagaceae bacterium]
MKPAPRLAITLGDPCGIGPEILLKILPVITKKWQITIYGSAVGLSILPKHDIEYKFCSGKLIFQSMELDWVDSTPEMSRSGFQIGKPSALSGKCAAEAVRVATLGIMSGNADALLTLPISKTALFMAGIDSPGHTELLQKISGSQRVRMAFISPSLKIVLHTVHQCLRSVLEELDIDAVATTLIFTARQFASLFDLNSPRIALCAINPHAGEGGLFGNEEKMLEKSIDVANISFSDFTTIKPIFTGPYPADSIFQKASKGKFDGVVALYHDQGLIPVKLLEPDSAVNLTLGLPFIRTSPDHGTAFDIAGKWIANPNNALAAAELAHSLLR